MTYPSAVRLCPTSPRAHRPQTRSWARRASLVAALALPLTLGALARAQAPSGSAPGPTDRDSQARALFENGRQAYEEGRYRDAWAAFHDAYQLSGRPELLYNIGQTADRLGQDADALKAFRMYIQQRPDAANRRDVENRIHALEERVEASSRPTPETLPDTPQTPATPPVATAPQQPQGRSGEAPMPPAARPHSGPARRGFYLRGALGFGYWADGISDSGLDASVLGVGPGIDFAAGYAVLPGLVVGGLLSLEWALRPTLTIDQVDETIGSALLVTFGPVVDWYIKRKSAGWHVQGSLFVSALSLRPKDSSALTVGKSATGVGLSIGGGYEFPLSGDWALGVMARLAIAGLADHTKSHGFVSPSLLATVSWF